MLNGRVFVACTLQCVKTHLRNMVVVPEMIGSIVGVYNGKTYNQVEIKVTCHMPAIVATILLYTDLFCSSAVLVHLSSYYC